VSNPEPTVMQAVLKHGGVLVTGDTRYDGVLYAYRSIWDEDEQVDAFIEAHPVLKSARGIEGGFLTLFFTPQS
jgi:hypothetical protein